MMTRLASTIQHPSTQGSPQSADRIADPSLGSRRTTTPLARAREACVSSFPPNDLSRSRRARRERDVRTRSGRYNWYRRHNRQNPTNRKADERQWSELEVRMLHGKRLSYVHASCQLLRPLTSSLARSSALGARAAILLQPATQLIHLLTPATTAAIAAAHSIHAQLRSRPQNCPRSPRQRGGLRLHVGRDRRPLGRQSHGRVPGRRRDHERSVAARVDRSEDRRKRNAKWPTRSRWLAQLEKLKASDAADNSAEHPRRDRAPRRPSWQTHKKKAERHLGRRANRRKNAARKRHQATRSARASCRPISIAGQGRAGNPRRRSTTSNVYSRARRPLPLDRPGRPSLDAHHAVPHAAGRVPVRARVHGREGRVPHLERHRRRRGSAASSATTCAWSSTARCCGSTWPTSPRPAAATS